VALKGKLTEMGLSDIVQVACKGKNRACLIVQSQGQEGSLFFENGQIVHAILDSQEGEDVIYELLTWDEGTFEIEQNVSPPKRTITTNWSGLLLEGMRRIDESAAKRDGSDTVMEFERKEEQLVSGRSPPPDVKKEDYSTAKKKEVFTMNVKKLSEAIDALKGSLGEGLITTDIWTAADGQSLAGFNPQPKASALFNQLTSTMDKALKGSGFPELGRYYILDLVGGQMTICMPLGDYQWGMLIDSTKAPLGLLLNVVIPQAIDAFEEAIAS
jgi:hypothetical protein